MKIDELHEKLKTPFDQKSKFGITKIEGAGKEFENIYFVVPTSPPREIKIDKEVVTLISEAMKVIGGLPSVSEMSEPDKVANYLFTRREVVQSSRLEGTWSTIDHALTPGELAERKEGKDEHQAIRSYANLMEEIVKEAIEKKEKIFTEKFICKIQKRIVENDPNSRGGPGKLRTEGEPGAVVTIGGLNRKEESVYNPAPASEVRRCLEEVLDWLKDKGFAETGDAGANGFTLPVRLAVAHSHFEAVHPFTDGNGRAGRTLWPIQMICSGYMPMYLSGYVEEKKEDYGKALQAAQKKLNYNPIIEFICKAIIESDLENKKTSEAILGLEDMWQERGGFKKNSGPRRALHLMLTTPIISTSILESRLGLGKTACVDAINSLVDKKIIKYRRTENRKKIYAAEELIQILSRPFGSDIDLALEKARRILEIK